MKAPRVIRQPVAVVDAAIVLIIVVCGLGLAYVAGFVMSVLWQWLGWMVWP